MKKLKMNLFAIVALAIAAVTMSFTVVKNASFAGEKWFEYTNATDDGNINNPANYELANGNGNSEPPCPTGTTERCAVHAQPEAGTPDQPDMSTVIATRLRLQQ